MNRYIDFCCSVVLKYTRELSFVVVVIEFLLKTNNIVNAFILCNGVTAIIHDTAVSLAHNIDRVQLNYFQKFNVRNFHFWQSEPCLHCVAMYGADLFSSQYRGIESSRSLIIRLSVTHRVTSNVVVYT